VSQHNVEQLGKFDIVMAFGLTHHLDNEEARDLFRLGHTALKPGGRMITHDGCYVNGQSAFARYLLRSDRGRFVRTKPEYEQLAREYFDHIQFDIRADVLRIPYYHLIMICTR
jgi:cyclopropane fatty-acyl-phospholipid synthase-like methyltransferase